MRASAEFADQAGLGGGEGEFAGDGGQPEAAVGVRRGREIVAQQRDLGVARGGEDQALQQGGEGDHGAARTLTKGQAGCNLRPHKASPRRACP